MLFDEGNVGKEGNLLVQGCRVKLYFFVELRNRNVVVTGKGRL